jgi:PhnB protein
MITINPYLNFNGNCLEAFEFYKSVFGGDFPYVGRYKDMPTDADHPLPEEMHNLILHMSLPISKETVLMGADTNEIWAQKAGFDGNVELMINAETRAEADAIWAKLSVGATITMPLADAFWVITSADSPINSECVG